MNNRNIGEANPAKPVRLALIWPLAVIAVFAWTAPLWFQPGDDVAGTLDWGHFLKRYEAIRRSFLQFHQWPGNMPWLLGGVPLLGNPEVGIFSVKTLLFLPLGVHWGVRLSLAASTLIALIGTWKLAGFWWRDPFIRGVFAAFVAANPALVYHLTAGHLCYTTFTYFPWLFYFTLRYTDDPWAGLKAALIAAIAYVDNVAYIVVFGFPMVALLFTHLAIRDRRRHFRDAARWVALFLPTFLALTAWRTANILPIFSE